MSIEFTYQQIFGGAILALLAVVAGVLTKRIGAPILLVFLVLGMLAGENGPGNIRFDDVNHAFLFGNIALAIIIFDGGLGTRKDSFRVSLKPAISLATFGVVITAAIVASAAYLILDLSWQEAGLIGAIVGSTDAAAVFGVLRNAGFELKERIRATLEIESGSNDPMAIFLTITFVHILQFPENTNYGWAFLTELVRQMGLGAFIGFAGGHLLTHMLRRISLPSSLYPLLALASGISLFALTGLWGGSGFLAIFIAGVVVGNSVHPYSNDINRFHDGIAWLSQIGMFLMLGLLITPSDLIPIILPATIIALVLIFVARPLAVFISLLPFHFPWREQVFVGWCGLRGAVPIILALFPSLAGLEQTQTFFELVFFVVLISLILQGWSIAPLAKWLQVSLPPLAATPDHLKLMIKNKLNKELMVYPVLASSQVDGISSSELPLHDTAQIAGVIRDGVLLDNYQHSALAPKDQVIILATSSDKAQLGRLFAVQSIAKDDDSGSFFGEFMLNPKVKLSDLANAYGFELPHEVQHLNLEEYFALKFHDNIVVGDALYFQNVKLIVQEIQGDHIVTIGLKFLS